MSNSNASWRRYAGAAARQLRLRGGATDGNSQVTALQRVAAERAAFEASLFSGIAHGEGLGAAVVRIARESSITKSRGSSRGFLQRLIDDPMGAPAGRLGFAVFLTRDALYESASVWFARAGEDIAIQFAAPEYVDTLFSTDESGHAESVATDLVAAGDSNEPLERLRLAKVLAKHRSLDLLETALAGLRHFHEETVLVLLLLMGAIVYGALVLFLLGRGWLTHLGKDVTAAADSPAAATLEQPDPLQDSAALPDNTPPPNV